MTVSPTPSETKTQAAGTSNIDVTPTSGKLLSKVTVTPTPSQTKSVTATTTAQDVTPDSGKLLSKVTVNPQSHTSTTTKTALCVKTPLDLGEKHSYRYVKFNPTIYGTLLIHAASNDLIHRVSIYNNTFNRDADVAVADQENYSTTLGTSYLTLSGQRNVVTLTNSKITNSHPSQNYIVKMFIMNVSTTNGRANAWIERSRVLVPHGSSVNIDDLTYIFTSFAGAVIIIAYPTTDTEL